MNDDDKIQLSLQQVQEEKKPLMGWAAVILGVIGIPFSAVFTIIGLVCSVIALFIGQIGWGITGILLALLGIVTSPLLMSLIGIGAIATWLNF